MAPKTKVASRKEKKSKNDETEERSRREERDRPAAEEEREGERTEGGGKGSGVESDAESTTSATGKQNPSRYDFNSEEETRLVEFFEQHDEFYNKGNPKYSNTQYKRKVLDEMAAQLNCHASKIQGWFKNQRTQVGKMMNPHKKKSGSGQEVLTTRKKWQLSSFKFLRAYIFPRSYTHDTELPDVPETSAEPETGDVADDGDNEPSASSIFSGVSEGKKRKRPRTQTRMDEALLKFLERPRESEIVAQKMQERDLGLSAEREAFLQWFGSRLHRVSEEKWDCFSEEAHQMLRKYTTTMPASTISAPSASLGAPPQLAAGPPAANQLQPGQWPLPQQQQQQQAMPTPQWQQWLQQQQPQWHQAQWQPTQQQPTQQQSTGQQTQQPDFQRPARSHSTPIQSVRQDDSLFDLNLPSMLSGSFTRMLKGSESQSEPLIPPERTMATSRNNGDDASDEGGQE